MDYGLVFSNSKNKKVPFTELFLLGGPYDLRGFDVNTQGPRKLSQQGADYVRKYNERFQRSSIKLQEKTAQLENMQKQTSPANKEEIEELQKVLDQYQNIVSAGAIDYPEVFSQRSYGGSQMFLYSLELEIPLFEQAGIRGAVFFDIGEANDKLKFNLKDQMRANFGFGIRWKSPFGPLSLDWAFPYKPRKQFDEEDIKFQFSFGSQF